MTPINQTERRKAFWNFLLFFVITVGIVITALAFSFQVPLKENKKLRREAHIAMNEKLFLQEFEGKIQETMNYLDSVNLNKNPFKYDNLINNNIAVMTSMTNNDAIVSVKKMAEMIIDNLRNLQDAKAKIRVYNNNDAELEKKDREIEQLNAQIEKCKDRLYQVQLSK